jgi:hypothetical protein
VPVFSSGSSSKQQTNMLTRMRILFLLCLSFSAAGKVNAQSIDYLRHNKIFNLCAFERECSGCYDCDKQKFKVKIKNLVDKKIKSVSYVYFSDAKNKIVTKEGVIIGGVIDYKQVAIINMCLPNGQHWAISEIVYEDDSKTSFVVKDRLDNFIQEPDECDCNARTVMPNPNIK